MTIQDCTKPFSIHAWLRLAALVSLAAYPAAAQLPVSFYQARPALPAINNKGLVVADFDLDGKLDSVVSAPFAFVFRRGLAGVAVSSPTPVSCVSSLITDDFNHDTRPDVACVASSEFLVALGAGNGTFGAPVRTSYASLAGIVSANLTADAIPDMVVWNFGFMDVYQGLGDGRFSQVKSYSYSVIDAKPGEFTQDGITDIVFTTGRGVVVVPGLGDGRLGFPRVSGVIALSTDYLSVADLNGDGLLDVVTTVNRSVDVLTDHLAVLLGEGLGQFADPVLYDSDHPLLVSEIGDVDRNGTLDVVAATSSPDLKGFVVFRGAGAGAFGAPETYVAPSIAFHLAALRGANLLDIALTDGNTTQVLPNLGNGTFLDGLITDGSPQDPCALADLSGDQKPDLACIDSFRVHVRLATNQPLLLPFRDVVPVEFIGPLKAVAIGDFNGDGKADIAAALGDSTIAFAKNNGNETFTVASQRSSAGPMPGFLVAADFTGDGKVDLVTDKGMLLAGLGDGAFASPATFYQSAPFKAATVGDFNNDTRPDLIAIRESLPAVVFLNTGGGTFSSYELIGVQAASRAAVGDLNMDGRLDLAIPAATFGISILIGRGDGTFLPVGNIYFDFWPPTISAAIGDFTGDGKPDLAFGIANYSIWITQGKGNGGFEGLTGFGVAESTRLVAGEFGNPGSSTGTDLLTGTSTITVLLNTAH